MDDYIRKTVSGHLKYKYFQTDDDGELVRDDMGKPVLKEEDVPDDEDYEHPDEYDRPVGEGKEEDDEDDDEDEKAKTGTEGDEFDSDDPLEWYDGQIRDVFEDDDEIYVRVRGEGGEDNNIPKDQILEELWESNGWTEEQIQRFEDEIEDMAD